MFTQSSELFSLLSFFVKEIPEIFTKNQVNMVRLTEVVAFLCNITDVMINDASYSPDTLSENAIVNNMFIIGGMSSSARYSFISLGVDDVLTRTGIIINLHQVNFIRMVGKSIDLQGFLAGVNVTNSNRASSPVNLVNLGRTEMLIKIIEDELREEMNEPAPKVCFIS